MLHAQFPRIYRRFLSHSLLGPVTDGLHDWLATTGYTRSSRESRSACCRIVDAELRRRRVKQVANLTLHLPTILGALRASKQTRNSRLEQGGPPHTAAEGT